MATEIGRSLEEIDIKVKGLNKTLKASTDETKELDKALKLDPKSAETVERKMKTLQTAVGTATQKVALLKQKQDEAYKAMAKGDLSAAEYKKIEIAVLKAENEVKALNTEITKIAKMKVDQTAAGFDKLTSNMNKAQAGAQKLAKAATVVLATLTAAATAFIVVGDELNDTSQKFRISAEQLQIQRNLYAKTTDDAKNFDKALSNLGTVMTSIAKGKGAAYVEVLNQLGVSTTDANGYAKTAAEVYGELIPALSAVSDETDRATMAQILFGENGLNVATVAGLTWAEVEELNSQLVQTGIVSSESAAKADEIASKLDDIKQQTQAATAQLMVALLPVILQLIEIAQVTIIPILNRIAAWFASMSPQQLQFVFFLLMLLIILPKIISVITAIIGVVKAITIASYGAAGGVGAVSAASMPLQPILLAVSAAILIVVLLFAMLAGKSKDVTSELGKQQQAFGSMQNQYNSMAADMDGTVSMTSQNNSTNTVNYDVNINAHGDTPISQEAAEMIADDLADRINASLGGKI